MPAKPKKAVGIMSAPPKAQAKRQGNNAQKQQPKQQKLPNLTKPQNQAINQLQDADLQLGQMANQQLPQIQQNFEQPFNWGAVPQVPQTPQWQGPAQAPSWDNLPKAAQAVDWSGAPTAPVTGDYNQWRQQQIDLANQDFEAQFGETFKDESESFEQRMYNKGIPIGSDAYNAEKTRMEKSQADRRRSNLLSAMNQAGNNATQFANIGFQSRDQYGQEQAQNFDQSGYLRNQAVDERQQQFDQGNTAWRNGMDDSQQRYNTGMQYRNDMVGAQQQQRYQPLNEYNMIRSSVSGMPIQNLGYSQGMSLQDDAQAHDRWMMQHTPRGGGNGGGGTPPMWQQYGFGSPMEFDAYQDSRNQANQMWAFQNDPRYRQPSGPSYGAQLGGGLLGVAGAVVGGSLF